MRSKQALRSLVTTLTLCLLLASAALTLAQDTAVEAAPAAEVRGIGTLFLLIGLGAVGLVSLVWLARERSAVNGDETA